MTAATRSYRMQARAAATEAATERILDACEELFWEDPARAITLAAVADRAGVSIHSILRRFGSREGMIDASAGRAFERAGAQRNEAIPGDVSSAVSALVEHYETLGDGVLGTLAAEHQSPALKEMVERGRELHAAWCTRVFAPALATLRGAERRRLLAQVIAVCDVYTWQILRRQRRLNRRETERALIEMLDPLVNGRSSR